MSSGAIEQSADQAERERQQQAAPRPLSRSRLVQRLLNFEGPIDQFAHDLIFLQASSVAGTEAAAFLVQPAAPPSEEELPVEGEESIVPPGEEIAPPQKFDFKALAHIRPDNSDAQTRQQAMQAFRQIVEPCVQQKKDGAFDLGQPQDGETQFCLVTLLRNQGEVAGVSAVITRCADAERAHQRLTSLQVVAGYFDMYTLRRAAGEAQQTAESHQHVLQLSTAVARAKGFETAGMNLCNELAGRTGASRVSLGWRKGSGMRLRAMSHTEEFDRRQELSVAITRVMEECMDQEEIVQFDPKGETSTPNVSRSASELSKMAGGATILSLPLRYQEDVEGVLTFEFAPEHQLPATVANSLALSVELLAPQLYDRHANDRLLITKAGVSTKDLAKRAVGPKHWLVKLVIILVIGLLAFVTLYAPMYTVASSFEFVPQDRRQVPAPFNDMRLEAVLVEPDDTFKAGDVLLRFDTSELESRLAKIQADKMVAEAQLRLARGERSPANEKIALAQIDSAQAQLDFLNQKIEQSSIRAPFDGQVLTGDLSDQVGAIFNAGDELLVLASLDTSLEAQLLVKERDVQNVVKGSTGELATRSNPTDKHTFTVTRVVPMGVSQEGQNTFRVFAEVDDVDPSWRPNMEGEARVNVEDRSLAWQWTHRLVEWVRLKLWI